MSLKDIITGLWRKSTEQAPVYFVNTAGEQFGFGDLRGKKLIAESIQKNPWLYAGASVIANSVSGIRWQLYENRQGESIEIYKGDNAVADALHNLLNGEAQPSMQLSSTELFRQWALYMVTQGEAFFLLDNPIRPTQLTPLYPWAVKVLKDKENFIKGFKYSPDGNEMNSVEYEPDEILWSRFVDLTDFYKGFSPIIPAMLNLKLDEEAGQWNLNNFENKGMPPAILAVKGGSTPEQREGFRDRWVELVSGKGVKKPIVLDAEKVSAEIVGMNPADMDFEKMGKENRLAIEASLSVPGQAIGDPAGQTYANYKEAMKALWENTIIPLYLTVMRNCLNNTILKRYGDQYEVDFDVSEVAFLQEDKTEYHDRVLEDWKNNLIDRAETRGLLSYDERTEDNGVYYVDTLMGNSIMGETEPATEEEKMATFELLKGYNNGAGR